MFSKELHNSKQTYNTYKKVTIKKSRLININYKYIQSNGASCLNTI